MSRYDDDWAVMDDGFGAEGDWGSLASGSATPAAVTAFIDDLRALADGEPPEPSAELAALLAGESALPRRPRPRGRLRHRRVVGVVAASVLVGGTGAAAANGRLPQPAQRVVSDVVNNLTPFTVPTEPDGPVPSPVDDPTPGPTQGREHRLPAGPVPEPSDDGTAGRTAEPSDSPTGEAADDSAGAGPRQNGAPAGETEPTREATGTAGGGERQGTGEWQGTGESGGRDR